MADAHRELLVIVCVKPSTAPTRDDGMEVVQQKDAVVEFDRRARPSHDDKVATVVGDVRASNPFTAPFGQVRSGEKVVKVAYIMNTQSRDFLLTKLPKCVDVFSNLDAAVKRELLENEFDEASPFRLKDVPTATQNFKLSPAQRFLVLYYHLPRCATPLSVELSIRDEWLQALRNKGERRVPYGPRRPRRCFA